MNKITPFILGIVLTAFSFHAYELYQIRKVTIENSTAIQEIVKFINENTKPVTP